MSNNLKIKITILVIGIIFCISLSILILMPNISLKGNNVIELKVGQKYKEPGYHATYLFQNKDKEVSIKGQVDENKLGSYKIKYDLNLGLLKTTEFRIVNVVDKEKPNLILKGNSNACPGKEYIEEGYEAIDNYDGNISSNVTIQNKKGEILYTVKDSSGNTINVTRKIQFHDIEAPKITLNGDEQVVVNIGNSYEEQGATVIDNCDGDITNKLIMSGEVNTSQIGQYTITYSATDSANNTSTITRTVNVVSPYNYDSVSGIGKVIYLTFDDGPSSTITPQLLQILREENVKATFFVINHDDSLNYLIKQEYEDGHTVALHSYTHEYSYVYSSVDNYFNDLISIQNKVSNIIGTKPNIIRFPGGSSNTVSRRYSPGIMSILITRVLDEGFIYFDWNVSSEDAGGARTASQVYNNVVNNLVYKNNVVLLHDFESNYKTLNAIRDIIQYGKSHGYIFKAITQDTYPSRHHVNN